MFIPCFSVDTSLLVNTLNLMQLDAQFLAEKLSRFGISHCQEEKLQLLPWQLAWHQIRPSLLC